MGVYYSIYAEVRVGNKWYNISPLIRDNDGEAHVQPVMSGQSYMKDAIDELYHDSYMRGRPENLSDELKKVYKHENHETSEYLWRNMTYGEYYDQTLFVVNYGKCVKSRVKSTKSTRYHGYVDKFCLSEYEIGTTESIYCWISEEQYKELPDDEKQGYVYYEWNEWYDWYGVYAKLVDRVDCLLAFFREWCFFNIKDADPDERSPTADYVRLIVERA